MPVRFKVFFSLLLVIAFNTLYAQRSEEELDSIYYYIMSGEEGEDSYESDTSTVDYFEELQDSIEETKKIVPKSKRLERKREIEDSLANRDINRVDGNGMKQGLWEKKEQENYLLTGHFVDNKREGKWTLKQLDASKFDVEKIIHYDNDQAVEIKVFKPTIDKGRLIRHMKTVGDLDSIISTYYEYDNKGDARIEKVEIYENPIDSCHEWVEKIRLKHKLQPCAADFQMTELYKNGVRSSAKGKRIKKNERIARTYRKDGTIETETIVRGPLKIDRTTLPPGSPDTWEYWDSTTQTIVVTTKLNNDAPSLYKLYKEYNKDGILKSETKFQGEKEISKKHYYTSGELETIYLNDPPDSKFDKEGIGYWKNGLLKMKSYEKGEDYELVEDYNEFGKLIRSKETDGNKQVVKEYWGNGKLKSESTYKGRVQTKRKEWDSNGNRVD